MTQETLPMLATDPPEPRLTVTEHLEELRRRLTVCVLTIVATTVLGFLWADRVIEWLRRPAGDLLPRLAFFSPTEALLAYCKVALITGVALAMPMVLYHIWAFIRDGLTPRERRYGLILVGWGSALFAAGVAFAYALCVPMFLQFLLRIGGPSLEPVISINQYLGFVTGVLLSCGVMFELPLALVVLAKLGIVTPAFLERQRSWALVVILIIAAVVTPTTDAFTMVLMALPLFVLYEASIWICRLTVRPRESSGAQSVRH